MGQTPDPLNDDAVEEIAAGIHETWVELGRQRGWLGENDGDTFDELKEKARSSQDAGERLVSRYNIDSSRAAARRMPEVLARIGLRVQADATVDDEGDIDDSDIERRIESNVELLAEVEHDLWMRWHLDQGWEHHEGKKNPAQKRHPCLVPFDQLSDDDQEKDRDSVRNYPAFARKAGYRITRD